MATTPSNSGGDDDDDDRESVGSGGDYDATLSEAEDEPEGGDSENEEGEGGDEEEEEEGEGGDGDEEQEEAEDFGSQRPEVLKKTPLPPEDDEVVEEEEVGDDDASSEEDEAPPTHDARNTPAAPPVTPPPATKRASTPPPAPVKKKAASLSQPTLVSKLKPIKDKDSKSADAPAPKGARGPKGPAAARKETPPAAPAAAASSGASTASTASAKPNGKQKAASTVKPKAAPHKVAVKAAAAAKRFEQSEDEEDGVSGEEAEAEASLNRPGEGLAERRPPTLQDTHPDVHMEADAVREREAANTREPASRQSGPPVRHVTASVDQGAAEQTAVFKAVGLAHRWYKHACTAILHQHTEGHEGDAAPFEVRFVDYVEKGNNNRAAVQKQLLEAHPEKFVALVRIAGASASTGGFADNQYHASIPITVVEDESSPDLLRKWKESKPPDSAFGNHPQVHWPLEHKVVELAYAEPNCPLPSGCDPRNVPKGDPKNGPKFVLIPGQNQIPNMEEWTHVSASAGSKRPKGGIEGSKRQKTNQATLTFGAATAAATGAPGAGASGAPAKAAAPAVAAAASSSGVVERPSNVRFEKAALLDQIIEKCHVIEVACPEKTTMTNVPGTNRMVITEWK